jgi:hypothetical protein
MTIFQVETQPSCCGLIQTLGLWWTGADYMRRCKQTSKMLCTEHKNAAAAAHCTLCISQLAVGPLYLCTPLMHAMGPPEVHSRSANRRPVI